MLMFLCTLCTPMKAVSDLAMFRVMQTQNDLGCNVNVSLHALYSNESSQRSSNVQSNADTK